MKRKSNWKIAIYYIIIILLIVVVSTLLLRNSSPKELTYSNIVQYFKDEQVQSFTVDGDNKLTLTLNTTDAQGQNETVEYELRDLDLFVSDLGDTIEQQYADGIIQSYDYTAPTSIPWWVSLIPYVIVFGVFIALWMYMVKQAGGGRNGSINAFGKSHAKLNTNEGDKVYFTDVAGAEEEKGELEEIVEFLRDPSRFTKLGAKIPHGVLLVGPPGTGKTLLAKAVAGEANVPFYSISGSDFVEMYVGVGASRVRDLFETARKSSPSIVFIDEIDAVGRHRGAGLGGGNDEREQTLNQLLVEMDGFGTNAGVIVIAATNRLDILDPALLRPGRFDRQITVHYPDIAGREAILKVHSKNKPMEKSVDLGAIARTTAGFTGADLANLINEAALLAARKNKSLIGMDELEDAFTKVVAGPQKRSLHFTEAEKRKTAYHEAGHAVISYYLPLVDPVRQISIIPSGNALGYTLNVPEQDKYSEYKEELKQKITELLGGRCAEKIKFDDISGGASNDIQRATQIAKKMIMQLGMSDKLGPITFGTGREEVFLGMDINSEKDYSEKVAAEIDDEIHALITDEYKRAEKILTDHMDKLDFVAEYLVAHESMNGDQFDKAMSGTPTYEELESMVAEKERRSREENAARAAQVKANEKKREEERRKKESQNQNQSHRDDGNGPRMYQFGGRDQGPREDNGDHNNDQHPGNNDSQTGSGPDNKGDEDNK